MEVVMNRHRLSALASRAAAALFLLALFAGPAAASTPPDAATRWNEHLLAVTAPPPPAASRPNTEIGAAAAYMHIAVYDAISSIDGNYTPFATRVANVPPGASREAAAIEAAYRILASLYPASNPTFAPLAAQFAQFYAAEMGAILPSQAKADGMAVGLAAANGLIAQRVNDGFRANVPYTFLPLAPGVYQKTPGPDGTIASYVGPATPWTKQFRPFAMFRPDQFRVDPPPALGSAQWAADYNEVKAFGAASNQPNSRSAEQEAIGLFYGAINAMVQVHANLRKLAMDQDLTADLGESSRFMAQAAVTISDAFVGCWDSKYLYNFWRPVTAIQHGDIDGNDATDADPAWMPQIVTPTHPEYPSAHGCGTSAYAHAIEYFFGTKRLPGGITLTGAGADRHFDSTDDIVKEIIDARVYNGVHYRTSVVEGSILGRKVAQWVAKFYFQPTDAHVPRGPKGE
jgi:hypothetical protein